MPEAVVAELEAQANHGREIGLKGLEELRKLSELAKAGKIELEYVGIRPNLDQIKLAGGGEIDAMIRDVALELGASFLTSDQVQSRVAEAMGWMWSTSAPEGGDQASVPGEILHRGYPIHSPQGERNTHGQEGPCRGLLPGPAGRKVLIGEGAEGPIPGDIRTG